MYALGGKWNEYLDAQRCDEEGDPLPDAKMLQLWKVRLLMCLLPSPASFLLSKTYCFLVIVHCLDDMSMPIVKP